jgi:hypothetical protein
MSWRTSFGLIVLPIAALACYCYFAGAMTEAISPGADDGEAPLVAGYQMSRASEDDIVIQSDAGATVVPAKVAAAGWNDRFIVAETNPRISSGGKYPHVDTRAVSYWIVDINHRQVHGPFASKAESDSERLRLRVPGTLVMRTPQQIFNLFSRNR